MEPKQQDDNSQSEIERWKIKKLIKSLEAARGNGTSMISLIIPPKDVISRVSKMLNDEMGTASNIKSKVNRLSVLSAITSTMQRLKLYTKVPPNGLVLYCGTVLTSENKERKVNIDFEPFKQINTSLYLCDNKFHTEALNKLLEDDSKFGFVVMDGSQTLWGVVAGSTRTILNRITVDLPKKHGRGGQSQLRFSRLRIEKRHNYVRKVAEMCTQIFITNDRPNVTKLILAGLANFKVELSETDMFDARLKEILLKPLIDVSYGGDAGFNQAIDLASDMLQDVKLMKEKKIMSAFFQEIAKDTGRFCYGIRDIMAGLDLGAVENLIVWDNLETVRHVVRNKETGMEEVLYLSLAKGAEPASFLDPVTGSERDIIESTPLSEWLAEHYSEFGTKLDFITDRSQEGSQFCKGFGGLGGLLRYRVDFNEIHGEHLDLSSGGDSEFSESDFL